MSNLQKELSLTRNYLEILTNKSISKLCSPFENNIINRSKSDLLITFQNDILYLNKKDLIRFNNIDKVIFRKCLVEWRELNFV